jgi:acetate CoA/acetoacetate CoA-transferase alpha subunit
VPAGNACRAHSGSWLRARRRVDSDRVGTTVAEGKRTVEVDGRDFLLEPPLKAEFALIAAKRCDYQGNLDYALTARNFNPVMAMAGTTVIVEPAEIVPTGVIPPDDVVTPHVLVDHIIEMDRSHG